MKKEVRLFFRLFTLALYVVSFLIVAFVVHLFTREPQKRRRRFVFLNHIYSRSILWFTNVRVICKNSHHLQNGPFLVVANHLGFVDIFTLASLTPLCFVTSQEMREIPLLGLITEMAGCIFVERRNRSGLSGEIENLSRCLKEGDSVLLYPEAQSHNGDHVLPFKRNLIMSAGFARVPVVPVVFNIRNISGEEFSLNNRDSVCWYGKMSFLTALARFSKTDFIEVEVEVLDPLLIKETDDKAWVADFLHSSVSAKFKSLKTEHHRPFEDNRAPTESSI